MRILIVSDTHRRNQLLYSILDEKGPFDALIHLGDVEGSEEEIQAYADCPCYMVAGNNDFFTNLPNERELHIGKYHVLLTHGHYYYVSMGLKELIMQGRTRQFDIVMYGHTHRPIIERDKNLIIVNPGSLSHPRQEGNKPSFILMELDDQGEAHFTINYIDKLT